MNYYALENTDVSGNGAGNIKHVGLLADQSNVSAGRPVSTAVDTQVNIFYATAQLSE